MSPSSWVMHAGGIRAGGLSWDCNLPRNFTEVEQKEVETARPANKEKKEIETAT
jgi:hypothetical protein